MQKESIVSEPPLPNKKLCFVKICKGQLPHTASPPLEQSPVRQATDLGLHQDISPTIV